MSVDLTSDPNGLFTRLGRLGGTVVSINSFIGTADLDAAFIGSLGVATDLIRDQFADNRTDLITDLYTVRDTARKAFDTFKTQTRTWATNWTVQMVNDDTQLTSKTLSPALIELIRQMRASGAAVDANTVAATATVGGSNTGNSVAVVSVLDVYGRTLEYCYDETLTLLCRTDSRTGGATIFRETWTMTGETKETNLLAWNWPAGSGASATLTSLDSAEDAGSNLLTNGDFETFTVTNIPDNWTIVVGTAGTQVTEGNSSDARYGSKCLKIIGDGSQLTNLTHTLTLTDLEPNTAYHVNLWMKRSTGLAAGVLKVDLIDGSAAVITDDASTNNATSFTLSTALTTAYSAQPVRFTTPKALPTTVKVRLILTTAITNTEVLYIDQVTMGEATQAYTGGPFVSVHGGSTAPVAASGTNAADKITIAVTNNYGGAFQQMFWRWFDMPTLGLILPSNAGGAESISDGILIAY